MPNLLAYCGARKSKSESDRARGMVNECEQRGNMSQPEYTKAQMNYADGEVTVSVTNAREATELVDWQTNGFTCMQHQSDVKDWTDENHLKQIHVPEIAQLAKALSGCDTVIAYPPLLRNPRIAMEIEDFAPIHFVHSDFTQDYQVMARDRQRDYQNFLQPVLEEQGLAADTVTKASHMLMLQFWRNTGPMQPQTPLAICAANSVPAKDLAPAMVEAYGGGEFTFETFGVLGADNAHTHRWYTYPSMSPSEVLVFRTFDSRLAASGGAFWTPHSAFIDNTVGANAPARESIEMRALCLFD